MIPSIPYTNTPDFPRLVANAINALRLGKKTTIAKTAAYTVAVGDDVVLVDATAAAVTVTLPTAASFKDISVTVKKTDASANAVTIDGNGSELIDGAATKALATQYKSYTVISDGAGWQIIAAV